MTMTRKEIEDAISGLPDGPYGDLQKCLIALGDLREEYGATIFRLAVASICLEAGEPMTPEQRVHLNAALDRLRRAELRGAGVFTWDTSRVREYQQQKANFTGDLSIVAHAYLGEHPPGVETAPMPDQQFENFIQRLYKQLVSEGMEIVQAEYIESVARGQWCQSNGDFVVIPKAEYERLLNAVDPAICRMQFPDGTVPGNAREAAEGWKRWADEFEQRAKLSGE